MGKPVAFAFALSLYIRYTICMSKENTERNEVIDKLRMEGKTLQQIGDLFKISRQRVMQILTRDTIDKKDEQV